MPSAENFYLLARCLAIDIDGKYKNFIAETFGSGRININHLVSTGDNHLILQTLYPVLARNNMDGILPAELAGHLKSIYELNSERNRKIIEQVHQINSSLARHGIFPVFLKGAGNICDDLYKDPGERILHDIDLLVEEQNFLTTVEILKREGYKSELPYILRNDAKHYPVLHCEGFPAFVEIHRRHLNNPVLKHFPVETVFERKVKSANGDCFVMCDEHKVIHNFLSSQVEGDGHYYALTSLRSLYDLLQLSKRTDPVKALDDFGYYRREAIAYINIFYKTFGISKRWKHSRFHSFRHELNIRSPFFARSSWVLLRMIYSYILKPAAAITDGNMRRSLARKLTDINWYKRHINNYSKKGRHIKVS